MSESSTSPVRVSVGFGSEERILPEDYDTKFDKEICKKIADELSIDLQIKIETTSAKVELITTDNQIELKCGDGSSVDIKCYDVDIFDAIRWASTEENAKNVSVGFGMLFGLTAKELREEVDNFLAEI